ncbi:hypothetical protein F4778DRAFT_415609 [Xylariomycetidae sp. FL2044]|nr:hypothetical protein F4778DRAFT_415609 [Xylariomycetidae sp. FL2044]
MGRKPAPQPLSLAEDFDQGEHTTTSAITTPPDSTVLGAGRPSSRPGPVDVCETSTLQVVSPTSSKSPKSPISPFSRFNPARKPQAQHQQYPPSVLVHRQPTHPADDLHTPQHRSQYPRQEPDYTLASSPIPLSATSPSLPASHRRYEDEKHSRSGSRFWNFGKTSRSANQLHHNHHDTAGEGMSRGAENPVMPDRVPSKNSKHSDQSSLYHSHQKSAPSLPSRSDVSLNSATDYDSNSTKKNKPKPFALLARTRSIKDSDGHSPKEAYPTKMSESEQSGAHAAQLPLKTAPLNPDGQERSFRHMMNSSARNHSADRALPRDSSANKENRHDKEHNRSHPSSFRDNSGSAFFSGLKSSGSRAADMISKGLFGKSGRSASTSEREPILDDEHYVLKVINRPLVEQTRMTRISKRLEDSKDKTEFWMPAFPWRAIDYLNFNGTDVEGLYRVPGSGPQIKKWQRRFDEEYDVDLFAQDDLYDINIIGSMLKAWLRELPDELFPKEAQDRIARECAGAEEVPQLLIDELSNLSPFNYYLLFAITCHLSLLLAHSAKNKMDFRNLCICFQPCMKIDAFCFKFLVCDWRLCWQGCKNEAKYIEEEYMLFQQPLPRGLSAEPQITVRDEESHDDRNVSSSDSSKVSAPSTDPRQNGKLRKKPLATSQPNGGTGAASLTVEYPDTPRRSGELRPLSPIKPLSPLGF